MKVLVPFTKPPLILRQVLETESIAAEYVQTVGDNDYWELLRRCWEQKDRFIVIERGRIMLSGDASAPSDRSKLFSTIAV